MPAGTDGTNPVLLLDRDEPATRHLSRIWTAFGCRNGIFSPIDRLRRQNPDVALVYFHPDAAYERLAAAVLGAAPFRAGSPEDLALRYAAGDSDTLLASFGGIVDSRELAASDLLGGLGDRVVADLPLLLSSGEFARMTATGDGVHVVGSIADVHVHRDASVLPGTVLDTRSGPVVIDAHASVTPFTCIAGPAYVGPDARVDNCRLNGPVVVGRHCRVGGEIEASVLGDFSNKHHEGFLGHSVVGRWVNLGALVTTSDLKNNYGQIRLAVPADFLAAGRPELVPVPLNRIKFGSLIGDCVKVAIGTCLNSGTVVDVGGNLFGAPPAKYVPPFVWGGAGTRYALDRFLKDCETVFVRRGQAVDEAFRQMVTHLWQRSDGAAAGPA